MFFSQIVNGGNLTTLIFSSTMSTLRLTLNYLPVNAVPHVIVALSIYTHLGLNITRTTVIDFDPSAMAPVEFADRTVVCVIDNFNQTTRIRVYTCNNKCVITVN